MKLTKQKLYELILQEMARAPMQDPTKDIDPELLDKLQKKLYDKGEQESGDVVIAALGGPEYFSKLKDRYSVETIMNEFEFAEPYLSTDQFKHLMLAKGKELQLGSNQFGMVGFQEAGSPPQVNFVIDPIELHDMVLPVATKQPQFGGKVLASDYSGEHESTQEHIQNHANYYLTLLKFFEAIIKISAKTYIHEYNIASYGMEVSPWFSELKESGKLVIGFGSSRKYKSR